MTDIRVNITGEYEPQRTVETVRAELEGSAPRYMDVLFKMPDGREIVVTISKDGDYRLMERADSDHRTAWGAPIFGTVMK